MEEKQKHKNSPHSNNFMQNHYPKLVDLQKKHGLNLPQHGFENEAEMEELFEGWQNAQKKGTSSGAFVDRFCKLYQERIDEFKQLNDL